MLKLTLNIFNAFGLFMQYNIKFSNSAIGLIKHEICVYRCVLSNCCHCSIVVTVALYFQLCQAIGRDLCREDGPGLVHPA